MPFSEEHQTLTSERIPSSKEMESRLSALMRGPLAAFIGRPLGLGDPADPREMSPSWDATPASSRG
jgi:hypothetical protein